MTMCARAAGGVVERARRRNQRRMQTACADLQQLAEHASAWSAPQEVAQLAEGVGLPCSVQPCGDQVTKATLDPALRSEQTGLLDRFEQVFFLLSTLGSYASLPPKPAAGLLDFYVLSPLTRARFQRRFTPSSYTLLGLLGEGSFGVVFTALELPAGREVTIKISDSFGEEETWMSERMLRHDGGRTTPRLRATFRGPSSSELRKGPKGEVLNDEGSARWIVWEYEGAQTIASLRNASSWPYNLEQYLFEPNELSDLPTTERKRTIYRKLIKEVAKCLASMHSTGIVHRDVKPDNILLSERKKRIKVIDLGGCCDLRTGWNYNPTEYVLDPHFSAPEAYALPRTTPVAPPAPLAMLLSAILWRINAPDRYDSFSLGLLLLHISLPQLRKSRGLAAARRSLQRCNYDVRSFRLGIERRALTPDDRSGLETLDPEAWELLEALLCGPINASKRLSMQQMLRHPWVAGRRPNLKLRPQFDAPRLSRFLTWLDFRLVRTGTANNGGFTEAQLAEAFQIGEDSSLKRSKELLGRLAKETISAAYTEAQGKRRKDRRPRWLKWR